LHLANLENTTSNSILSEMFADQEDGQVSVDHFVWSIASSDFARMLSPIAATLCSEFSMALSNGNRIRQYVSYKEAHEILGSTLRSSGLTDQHIG
jgi:hypothetical protein